MIDPEQAQKNLTISFVLIGVVVGVIILLVVLIGKFAAKNKKGMSSEYEKYAQNKGYQYSEAYDPTLISESSLLKTRGSTKSLNNAISGTIKNLQFSTFIFDYGLSFALGARVSGFSARLVVFDVQQKFEHVLIYGGSYLTKNNGYSFETVGEEVTVNENKSRFRVFCSPEATPRVKQFMTPELLRQLSSIQDIDTIELLNNQIIIATSTSQVNRQVIEYKPVNEQKKDYGISLDGVLSSSADAASLIESAVNGQKSKI